MKITPHWLAADVGLQQILAPALHADWPGKHDVIAPAGSHDRGLFPRDAHGVPGALRLGASGAGNQGNTAEYSTPKYSKVFLHLESLFSIPHLSAVSSLCWLVVCYFRPDNVLVVAKLVLANRQTNLQSRNCAVVVLGCPPGIFILGRWRSVSRQNKFRTPPKLLSARSSSDVHDGNKSVVATAKTEFPLLFIAESCCVLFVFCVFFLFACMWML